MSQNPYSPPEIAESVNAPARFEQKFPIWSIGPKSWIAVFILNSLIAVITGQWNLSLGARNESLDALIAIPIMLTGMGLVYGSIYAWVLSVICRRMKRIPRSGLHTCMALMASAVVSPIGLPMTYFITIVSLVSGIVAIFTARPMADLESKQAAHDDQPAC